MRKGILLLVVGLLLAASCKQKIKVVDSETMEEITDMAAATDVNNTFVDIALPGPQGQTVRVRDYVGQNKLVLIDFWASWCGIASCGEGL